MFQLDDNFLTDVGLGALPDDQKQAFLQHIYEELELRVGTKLSEGLSEQQMGEFEAFVDQAEDKVRAWFATNLSDYASRQDFVQLSQSAPEGTSELAILCEYGSLKWLELNRPDYRDVVAAELETLKSEIRQNASTILGTGDLAQAA
ncbi:hypothetical protein KA093_02945 [Candidatus Saccharibacteria bacterium]|nr:hypothetical protein [Candidatus Saccharibacteria bacterium]